jgi:hypothetical protein
VPDDARVPFCLGGSWASTLHGQPRQTLDIDLIVEMRDLDVAPLLAALPPELYVNPAAVHEAVASHRSFSIIGPATGTKADCFVRGSAPFDQEEFARRRVREVSAQAGISVPVKSPEDSILRKLLWYRDDGRVSEHQWRDVLGVLAVNAGALDTGYLDRWAADLGITDLLERARGEASRRALTHLRRSVNTRGMCAHEKLRRRAAREASGTHSAEAASSAATGSPRRQRPTKYQFMVGKRPKPRSEYVSQ